MQQLSKFKKTNIGEIPEEWQIGKLREYTIKIGSGITPRGGNKVYQTTGIPFIRSQNVHFDGLHLKDVVYISDKIDNEMKNTRIQPFDVLLNITGASIGRCTVVPKELKHGNVNQHVCIIRPKKEINPIFLSIFLSSNIGQKLVHSTHHGLSREGLTYSQIAEFSIPIPSLKEQQKIASILSKVDELIQKTEQIIEQTQRLKKGLMQRLLTKGIEHTKFKKTELGEIPEEWELLTISQISKLTMGQSPSGNSYNVIGEGIPILNGPTEFGLEYPTPVQYTTKPTKLCQTEDILLCVRGSTTGRLNLANGTYCIGRGLALIRGLENKTNTKWLYYHFLRLQNYIYNIASGGGSTFPNINRDLIEKIIIPYPTLKEQQKIASILSTIDLAIQRQQEYKLKIKNLKNGLMQQLLTGKIRVKV